MATRDEMVAVCDQYLALLSKGDVDGIVALYAPDARVEDPIGTPAKHGTEEIRGFYASVSGTTLTATRIGPVTIVGHEAAFLFRIDVALGPDKKETLSMASTDLMTFNDAGKITRMTAYADGDAKP